jgi:hypothetical protein
VAAADGRMAVADGRMAAADGRAATADGRVATADGRVATTDGRVATTDTRPAGADECVAAPDTRAGRADRYGAAPDTRAGDAKERSIVVRTPVAAPGRRVLAAAVRRFAEDGRPLRRTMGELSAETQTSRAKGGRASQPCRGTSRARLGWAATDRRGWRNWHTQRI